MASARLHIKRQFRFQELSYAQQDMAILGQAAISAITDRVTAGRGPDDNPAKPLGKKYAAFKQRVGLKPIRDLRGTGFAVGRNLSRAKKQVKPGKRFIGHMLDNLSVRTVTEFSATIALTSFAARIKGSGNQQVQPWLLLSPMDRARVRITVKELTDIAMSKILVPLKRAA